MGWRLKTQTSSSVQTSDKLSESIYGAWHVSFFDWFLSQIEALLRLPCIFPIKTTPLSSNFSTFRRNTLSEHIRPICQRSVRSILASFILIRSLFGSISNFFPFLLLCFIFHFPFETLYLVFVPPSPFLNPSVLGSITTCRQCLVRQVTSRSFVTEQVMKKCTCQVIARQSKRGEESVRLFPVLQKWGYGGGWTRRRFWWRRRPKN